MTKINVTESRKTDFSNNINNKSVLSVECLCLDDTWSSKQGHEDASPLETGLMSETKAKQQSKQNQNNELNERLESWWELQSLCQQ